MILQEYLPGPASAHVLVDGFQDRAGVARARLARRRVRKYPPDLGDSTSGIFISLDEVAEPLRSLDELLAGLGYRGMVSAEFKLDPRDGVYKLLEVNCRPFGHFESVAALGHESLPHGLLRRARASAAGRSCAAGRRPVRLRGRRYACAPGAVPPSRALARVAAGLAGAARLPAHRDDPLPAAFTSRGDRSPASLGRRAKKGKRGGAAAVSA